jgi:hypothetical protein
MPFYHGFDNVPIRRHQRKEEGKFLRFNHDLNQWERGGPDGWTKITVSFARTLREKGWKLWDIPQSLS